MTIEAGRKRVIRSLRRNWSDWEILIKDHHEGYITWAEFERNQRLIADNANGMSYLGRGSVRRGGALLPGLFRCARCGRKLQVSYGGSKTSSQRYACRGAFSERAEMSCINFGGMRVDRAVAGEVLDRVQPFGIEAALAAVESLGREQLDKLKQLENAIEQVRFEAARARRQYEAVDPENRLVAADLERRWNEKLGLCMPWKSGSAKSIRNQHHQSKMPIAYGCSSLEMTCLERGIVLASPSRRARKSSGS